MSLWIKICGNTSVEDALLAAEAGADAVGFVFARGPRQVTVDKAAAIVPPLPKEIEKIGVFVDASSEEIASAIEACGLTGVQLHFDVKSDAPARLRQHFGPDLRILRVVHFEAGAADKAQAIASDPDVDAILVDSRTATAVGGTGVAFDWEFAGTALFKELSAEVQLVVAGGLTPTNVVDAIRMLSPWGVDVVSGVEASPGRKDPEKVRQFIANARALTLA